ncbi:MAG: amidohydrolase [Desulfobacteraceae bacterium]|nr:MAG: amidohydrolase [Desulfobacteraceae bacterium]
MAEKNASMHEWLREIRRDLHAHPELGFREFRTTERIIEILSKLGWDAQPAPGTTGAIGLLQGSGSGPVIGLRADIDALPVSEQNDVPYRSQHQGVMHACGHDANTAIMLGVAKKITDTDLLKRTGGSVKLIFQPAEEGGAGAKTLIEGGVLENPRVDVIFAGHMSPDLQVGRAGVFKELGYASSDSFVLDIRGRGGHGARAEECIDPIVAGAHFVTQIQTIVSRNISPTMPAVLTIGCFTAGSAANIIPETAQLQGSIRALSTEVRGIVIRRLEELTKALEESFGVACRLVVQTGIPILTNNPSSAALLLLAARTVVGEHNASYLPPIMASDDFAYFTQARPGAIVRLGCSNPEKGFIHKLHNPRFDIDEDVLSFGVDIFFEAITSILTHESIKSSLYKSVTIN